MNLLQLKYFKRVAELEHVSKASEQMHVAQPSISRTIKSLERELGSELFERQGKYIKLNKNGEIVLKHANVIISSVESIKKELSDSNRRSDNTVIIEIDSASKIFPKLVLEFKKIHPDIVLKIIQQSSERELNNKCDLKIFSSINCIQRENVVNLLHEEIVIAIPKCNHLVTKKTVELRELINEEFICLKKGKNLREITDEYCRQANFSPNIVLESDNPDTIRSFINSGGGVSFMPKITWDAEEDEAISLLSISKPICTRFINMSWDENNYMSRSALLFRDFVIEYFSKLPSLSI